MSRLIFQYSELSRKSAAYIVLYTPKHRKVQQVLRFVIAKPVELLLHYGFI